MERRSIKKVGVPRPTRGVKIVDISEKRYAREKQKKRDMGKVGSIMMIFICLLSALRYSVRSGSLIKLQGHRD